MAQRLGKARKSGSPAQQWRPEVGILLDLVRNRRVSRFSVFEHTYGASERTLLRDLQELRKIGETAGFTIGERETGDTFVLSEFNGRPAGMLAGQEDDSKVA